MPFTAAHPAIILPLLRRSRWLSTTGLVIGSMAPDFEYFFRLQTKSEISHTLPGILFFNLPVTFLLATVFHMLVRDLVASHLPGFLSRRIAGVKRLNWLLYLRKGGWISFALSACIGSASHIFWDSFTHSDFLLVRKLPILLTPIDLGLVTMPLSRVIQHLSTVFGSLAIFYYTLSLKPHQLSTEVSLVQKFGLWFAIAIAGILFMAVALKQDLTPTSLRGVIVSFLSGTMLASVAFGFLTNLRAVRTKK